MSARAQQVASAEEDVSVSDKKTWASRKPGKAEVLIYSALLANGWIHQYRLTKDYKVNAASADKWLKRLHDHTFLERRQAVHARRRRFEYALTSHGRSFVLSRLEQHGLEEEVRAAQMVVDATPGTAAAAAPVHVEVAAARLLRLGSRLAVGNSGAQALVRRLGSLPNEAQKLQEAVALVEGLCGAAMRQQLPESKFESLGNHFKLSALTALLDGRLVSAGHDRAIRVWSRDPTEMPITIQAAESVVALAPLNDDPNLFVSADVHAVRLWDLDSFKPKVLLRMKPSVTSALCVLPRDRVALADSSPLVQVLEMGSGTVIATLEGHARYVHTLLAPTSNRLVSASEDRLVVWDLNTRRPVFAKEGAFTSVATLSDEVVAYAAQDYKVRLLDFADGQVALTLKGHRGRVKHLLSMGSNLLVSAGADGQVRVWDTSSGACAFAEEVPGSIRGVCASGSDLVLATNSGDILKLKASMFVR